MGNETCWVVISMLVMTLFYLLGRIHGSETNDSKVQE
jgi:hypothetical protein